MPITMRIPLFLTVLMITVAAQLAALDEQRTLTWGGLTRYYLVYAPASLPPGPRPLVLVLHPSVSNAQQFRTSPAPATNGAWDAKAAAEGFIVVYPNGTSQASYDGTGPAPATDMVSAPFAPSSTNASRVWNSFSFALSNGVVVQGSGVDDIGFLDALITQVSADLAVDPDRIYMTGFSNGAMMANTFAILRGNRLGAAAPVSGGWINDYAPTYEAPLWPQAPLPMWTWRGSKEQVLKPTNNLTRKVQDEAQRSWWIDRDRVSSAAATWTSTAWDDAAATTRTLFHETYADGRLGIEYRFTTVGSSISDGTSHQWQPGAVDAIWDFFKSNRRRLVQPSWTFAAAAAGAGDQALRGIDVDGAGAVALCGSYSGTTDLIGQATATTGSSDDDACMIMLEPGGAVRWRSTFGTTAGKDRLYDVIVDGLGRPVATGQFAGTLTIGGSTFTSAGGLDAITVCYDPGTGAVVWARQGASAGGIDLGNEIVALAANAGTAVVGNHSGSIPFAGRTLPFQGSGGGGLPGDICVLRYGSTGSELWGAAIGSTAQDGGRGIAAMPDGGVVVAGDVTGAATVTDGLGVATAVPVVGGSTAKELIVARFAADGALVWVQRLAGAGDVYARGVGVDANGWITLSGACNGSLVYAGATLVPGTQGQAVFVMRIGPDLSSGSLPVAWTRLVDGAGDEDGCEVQTDRDGSVVVSGDTLSPSLVFGSTTLTNQGGKDVFVAALDRSGAWTWARTAGGSGNETSYAVAVDWRRGRTVACGTMQQDGRFGSITLSGAPGQYDGFIASLDWRLNQTPVIASPAAAQPASMILP